MNDYDLDLNSQNRVSKDTLFHYIEIVLDKIILIVLLLSVCIFVLYPMLCIFIRSFRGSSLLFPFHNYLNVIEQYRRNIKNSVFVGVFTAILTTVISISVALFLADGNKYIRRLGGGILLISLVSPPFVSSLAYIQLYGRRGWITYRLLHLSWDPYNCWGVIFMQSISFVPLNAIFLNTTLEKLDSTNLLAARDLGAKPKAILLDILLPLLKPSILVCLLLGFIRSLSDYGTPVIIGGRFSTIASEIYLQLVGYSNLEKASAMNMILLIPTIILFFAYRKLLQDSDRISNERIGIKQEKIRIYLRKCGIYGVLPILVSMLFFIMMTLQYLCIFSFGFMKSTKGKYSFTLQNLEKLIRYDSSTMIRSVEYAFFIAVFGSIFAAVFAYYMERRKIHGRGFFDFLITLPYMIPGTCFGIGYILAFNHIPLKLTGTSAIVLINMLFKQLPTCSKLCSAALSQIPKSLEQSVSDLGGGRFSVFRDAVFPGLRPALFNCFIYNFSSSMTTAGAILFLINPGKKLAVFQLFNAVYTGEYALASLMASFIILIVLLVEGTAYLIMKGWKSYVS